MRRFILLTMLFVLCIYPNKMFAGPIADNGYFQSVEEEMQRVSASYKNNNHRLYFRSVDNLWYKLKDNLEPVNPGTNGEYLLNVEGDKAILYCTVTTTIFKGRSTMEEADQATEVSGKPSAKYRVCFSTKNGKWKIDKWELFAYNPIGQGYWTNSIWRYYPKWQNLTPEDIGVIFTSRDFRPHP